MKRTIAEISAGCIVYTYIDEAIHILVLKNSTNRWGFAKGRIEPDEALYDCAIRETQEETGINDITLHPKFHHMYTEKKEFETEISFKTTHLFLTKTTQSVKISSEHIDFAWVKPDKALELLHSPNQKAALQEALAVLNKDY